MDKVERALEVNGDDGVPLLLGHAQHESVLSDTGVVDQDIDFAKLLLDLLDHFFGLRKVGSVAGISLGLHAQGSDFLLGLLAVLVDDEVGECDISAFAGILQGNSLANSTCGTSDKCHFSFE